MSAMVDEFQMSTMHGACMSDMVSMHDNRTSGSPGETMHGAWGLRETTMHGPGGTIDN